MKKVLLTILILLSVFGCGKKDVVDSEELVENKVEDKIDVKVVDVNSNSRPYAVVVNNSPVAVKVQEGLGKAYMVYELPVEGYLTRLLAFYKDIDDLKIGTIRSARHNFLDYVFEQDAIFVHFGWSKFAREQINELKVNNLNGLSDSSFWRENPLGLAVEHTAYTSLAKSRDLAKSKNYSLTTDKGLVFEYDNVSLALKEDSKPAKKISIPAGSNMETSYVYDEEKEVYNRFVNGSKHIDYQSKEQYTAKNIIIQKIKTAPIKNSKYWELTTTGEGEGVFITNGYAVPIKWQKKSRKEKTVYTYLNGEVVKLNDGNVYMQLQSTLQDYVIE